MERVARLAIERGPTSLEARRPRTIADEWREGPLSYRLMNGLIVATALLLCLAIVWYGRQSSTPGPTAPPPSAPAPGVDLQEWQYYWYPLGSPHA